MTHKFKKDDIITLTDNPEDKAIQDGNKGFYKIIEVTSDSYGIYSLLRQTPIGEKNLEVLLAHATKDYKNLVNNLGSIKVDKKYPVHLGKHSSVKEWIETSYRLATEKELEDIKVLRVLYAK